MSDLNSGQGQCKGTARMLLRPVLAVIELGASEDVLREALHSVHHANRHGSIDDFLAVALPMMHMGREVMRPGHETELIGSEESLSAFLSLEGVSKLIRRGMIEKPEIGEVFIEPGDTGAAYIRDRSVEQHTPGWIRRTKSRAERRGKPLGKSVKPREYDKNVLTLNHGMAALHIREIVGVFTDSPLMVSTYGFSTQAKPAILPVFPESAREAENAA